MRTILILATILCMSCSDTNNQDCMVGKYYKIENYNISIKLPQEPRVSKDIIEGFKSIRYDYAMENSSYDNFLYGIKVSVQDPLNTSVEKKDSVNLLNTFDSLNKYLYEKGKNATLVDRQDIKFKNRRAIKYKFKATVPQENLEVIINHILFVDNNTVIDLYVYSDNKKDDNKLIDCFFNSIKLN